MIYYSVRFDFVKRRYFFRVFKRRLGMRRRMTFFGMRLSTPIVMIKIMQKPRACCGTVIPAEFFADQIAEI